MNSYLETMSQEKFESLLSIERIKKDEEEYTIILLEKIEKTKKRNLFNWKICKKNEVKTRKGF